MVLNYPNRQYKPIAVTISLRQQQFLKETGFKPSKLLQQAIEELMQTTNEGDIKTIIQFQKDKARQLLITVEKQRDFIERNGLLGEYIK